MLYLLWDLLSAKFAAMITSTRSLIDTHFSLQWCSENIARPLAIRRAITLPGESGKEVSIIAVANFLYLATIGDFIKTQAAAAGYEYQIIKKPPEEIEVLVDNASEERIISGEGLETSVSDLTNTYL